MRQLFYNFHTYLRSVSSLRNAIKFHDNYSLDLESLANIFAVLIKHFEVNIDVRRSGNLFIPVAHISSVNNRVDECRTQTLDLLLVLF